MKRANIDLVTLVVIIVTLLVAIAIFTIFGRIL
jgi:hypothetical protein